MKVISLIFALLTSTLAYAQTATSCPMHEQHMHSPQDHSEAVNSRGDKAMGFSHEKSTHHFQLLLGGMIEVNANDRADTVTLNEIRSHLSHIAQMFTAGNFEIPILVHDTVPAGVPVMKAKRTAISYTYESTPTGAGVRIATSDEEALKAIHQFLGFQIDEHKTGDTSIVKP